MGLDAAAFDGRELVEDVAAQQDPQLVVLVLLHQDNTSISSMTTRSALSP